jgi:hypothetical protein
MPARPTKEPVSVTIGNLELANRNLTARVVDLVKVRDDNHATAQQWREQAYKAQAERDKLRLENEGLARAVHYNDGYIARVKETDNHMFGAPFSSSAP